MTKTTFDQCVNEAFGEAPTSRDLMEPWQRISILIQSGMNYAMFAEMERGKMVGQDQVAEGVTHALCSILYTVHANAIENTGRPTADATVKHIVAGLAKAATDCFLGTAPAGNITNTTYVKPPN
jgi:hypothetical protein